jgi:hypothetical protein
VKSLCRLKTTFSGGGRATKESSCQRLEKEFETKKLVTNGGISFLLFSRFS